MERCARVDQDTESESEEDGAEQDPGQGEQEGGGGEPEEQEEDAQNRLQEPEAGDRRGWQEEVQRRGIFHIQS